MYKLALLTGGCNHVVAVSSLASAISAWTLSFFVAAFGSFGTGDLGLDVFALSEHLFPSDEVGDTMDEGVDEGDFGVSESVGVGDIELTTFSGGVDTGSTSGLESESVADVLEVGSGRELGDEAHASSTETGSTVGGAGEDETEMIGVHEVGTGSGEDILDSGGGVTESLEDGVNVITFFHGDDSGVILLVDPDKEVLGLVVENTTGVGPVATTSRGEEEGGIGFLEKVTVLLELLGVRLGHTLGLLGVGSGSGKREVLSSEITLEGLESSNDESLNLASLFEVVARGESETLEGSSGSASGSEDVFAGGIDLSAGDLGDVHIGGMLGISSVSSVSEGEDGLHDVGEKSPGLFISGNETTGLDHGVTLVVDTGLNAVTDVDSEGSLQVLVLGVDSGVLLDDISAERFVLGEVGKLSGEVLGGEGGSLLGTDVLGVTTSELDPLGEFLDTGVESGRRIVDVTGGGAAHV